jgi:hypothetical protein
MLCLAVHINTLPDGVQLEDGEARVAEDSAVLQNRCDL